MEKHNITVPQKHKAPIIKQNTDNCYIMAYNRKLEHIYCILKDILPLKFDCIDHITQDPSVCDVTVCVFKHFDDY